jgi:hypothetical protein
VTQAIATRHALGLAGNPPVLLDEARVPLELLLRVNDSVPDADARQFFRHVVLLLEGEVLATLHGLQTLVVRLLSSHEQVGDHRHIVAAVRFPKYVEIVVLEAAGRGRERMV